jgi:hypothetical protein
MSQNKIEKAIRKAIDDEKVEELQRLFNANPEVDLNAITQNGLSALWWALSLQDKKPSTEIISLIIATNRVDPTQRYCGRRLEDFTQDSPIRWRLQNYEAQYVRLRQEHRVVDQGAALRDFMNDSQNTHDPRVVHAVDISIIALYKRYVGHSSPGKDLFWDEGLAIWLKSLSTEVATKELAIKTAENAIDHIRKFPDVRNYKIDEYEVSLTNAQVLMLLWKAVNSEDKTHY